MTETSRVIYFDCFAGASGDMIIGSLLDLGLDLEKLKAEIEKLSLEGYKIEARKVTKCGFSATKFEVFVEHDQHDHHHHHQHGHHHDHDHDRQHDHHHDHHHDNHNHDHQQDHVHNHRNLNEIVGMIQSSQLTDEVKEKSISIFRRLAVAEARIHGTVPEKIHFHEVGAVDAIVDIVSAVVCLHLLQIDKVIVSPLPMGKGFVKCHHGIIPVPAPATLELLKGLSAYGSEHNGETVTPTGAAILSTLAEECGPMPQLNILNVGYGAGTRDFGVPNLLRAIMGEESKKKVECFDCSKETVVELEANIDDMNPEFFDYIFEQLFNNGALDVFLIPVQMKKNRPASLIRVLCSDQEVSRIAGVMFKETSTIGVRLNRLQRLCLQREIIPVQTEYGEIRIKQAVLDGHVVNHAPEYEDCREKARAFSVPLKMVYNAALRAIEATQQNSG